MNTTDLFLEAVARIIGSAPTADQMKPPGQPTRWGYPAGAKNKNAWCWMFPDGEGGTCGVWGTSIYDVWQHRKPVDEHDRKAWQDRIKIEKQKHEEAKIKRYASAAICATQTANESGLAPDDFQYFVKKGIPASGAKITNTYWSEDDDGQLILKTSKKPLVVLPIKIDGQVVSLQYISIDGFKWFMPQGEIQGGTYRIGDITPDGFILCEGLATGASLHETSDRCVIVAFNSGNLIHVARKLRKAYPGANITIAADDDAFNRDGSPREKNEGVIKATAACLEIKAKLAVPKFPEPRTKDQGSDFNDLFAISGKDAVNSCLAAAQPPAALEADEPAAAEPPPAAEPTKSMFMSALEFIKGAIAITWLIYGLIPKDSTGQIFGPSGGGKTFNALDMALATAADGSTLNGRKAQQGIVLYLAGEGHAGLRRRVKAYQLHHNKTDEDLSLFYLSRNTINFNVPEISAAVAEGKALSAQHGAEVALIVVDTLARHLEGDENSTSDMGAFIRAVDNLRNAFPGSVALIVHHSGHAEDSKTRARGSSALKGAMDFEIMCDRGLLTFTKLKDGEAPPAIEFKLVPVKIGEDADGEPITSCVVTYGERSTTNRAAELKKYERVLLDLVTGSPDILIGELRDAFYAKRTEREPDIRKDTLKHSFKGALDGLLDKEIAHMDGYKVKAGGNGKKRENIPTSNGRDRDTTLKEYPDNPACSRTATDDNFLD